MGLLGADGKEIVETEDVEVINETDDAAEVTVDEDGS